jgi:uncharacterized protein (TIGR02996 family)
MARNAELEAAIVADPEAEGSYVVYGDWLLAEGDPRGELVAVQLALETAEGARWAELKRREQEILWVHAGALLGPAAHLAPARRFDWRRGFIDRMYGQFLGSEGEELMAHPSLALVRAVGDVELDAIRQSDPPLLGELAVKHHALADLLAWPRVRRLAFEAQANLLAEPEAALVGRSTLEALAFRGRDLAPSRACDFPALREVRVADGYLPEGALEVALAFVAACPHATLDLALNESSPIDELSPGRVGPITRLRLRHQSLQRLRALRGRLPGVRALELSGYYQLDPALAPAEVDVLPSAERLISLKIRRRIADPRTSEALIRSPCAATLERLELALTDRAAVAALCRGAFPALRVLELEGSEHPTVVDLDALADAAPRLDELALHEARLRQLCASRLAGRIQTLTFRSTGKLRLMARGLPAIDRLTALRRIRVDVGEPLGPEALEALGRFGVAVELAANVPAVGELI